MQEASPKLGSGSRGEKKFTQSLDNEISCASIQCYAMFRPLMRRSRAALVPAKILPKPESQRVRKLNGCMVKSLHICTIERNRREAPGVRRFTVAVRVAADRREKRSF